MTTKPRLFMLVGAPGTGKSTWIATQPFDWSKTVVASSDGHIERHAKQHNSTYSNVFQNYIGKATELMHADIADAIQKEYDIVWDQTNMAANARRSKLKKIPDNYEKYAVVFLPPKDEEHARRLANRPGKHISPEVVASMISKFEMPSEKEGFDHIIVIDNK